MAAALGEETPSWYSEAIRWLTATTTQRVPPPKQLTLKSLNAGSPRQSTLS